MVNLNRSRLKNWTYNPDKLKEHSHGDYGLIQWYVVRVEDAYGHWQIVTFNDAMGHLKLPDRLFIVRKIEDLRESVTNYLRDVFDHYAEHKQK